MPITVRDILHFFDRWAPREIAWEGDNTGLQIGDPGERVRGILLALDATEAVAQEAVRRKANLLVTHHPLLFHPLRSVTPENATGRTVRFLLRSGLNVYSAHTNLDFTRGGTSFALGDRLDLRGMTFLSFPYRLAAKVVTFAPAESVEAIAAAMAAAGAGQIGNYEHCSFRTEGTGTFRGNLHADPAVGRRNRRERVQEVRLEMVTQRRQLPGVLEALKRAHPYEEPAYDVHLLDNPSRDHGMGVVGELDRPVPLSRFLGSLKRRLGCRHLRWSGNPAAPVRRIAVCGGAGADLLEDAVRSGAEVFVTADLRYHAFHDATGRIALVDAGHHETEFAVIGGIAARLREFLRGERSSLPVMTARTSTNPVRFM